MTTEHSSLGVDRGITDERFLEILIEDPSWCIYYHRARVVALLPRLAEAFLNAPRDE